MFDPQVGLVPASPNLGSYVVVWASGSAWTHMIVRVSETHAVSLEPPRARLVPITTFPDTVWSQFTITPDQAAAIVAYANSRVGDLYGWAEYLLTGWTLLTRLRVPRWLERFIGREDRTICSQLAYRSLTAGGITPELGPRRTQAVTPADFGNYFLTMGWADRA